MTNNTDRAKKPLRMGRYTRDTLSGELEMGKELFTTLMEQFIEVSLSITTAMVKKSDRQDMEFMNGRMARNMKANGERTRWLEKER